MTRHPRLVITLVSVATLLAYAVCVLGTAVAACGIFGCSGGKAAYEPGSAQLGLLLCGLVLVPLAVLLLRHGSIPTRAAGAAGAAVVGAVLAMVLSGIGPHGCPAGQSRATVGPGSFDAGAATCSGDADALA